MQKCKGPRKAQTTCKNDNKSADLLLPDFKTYQGVVMKTVRHWHKDKLINGTESRVQKQSHTFMNNFNKGVKKIQWRTDNLFNKWC